MRFFVFKTASFWLLLIKSAADVVAAEKLIKLRGASDGGGCCLGEEGLCPSGTEVYPISLGCHGVNYSVCCPGGTNVIPDVSCSFTVCGKTTNHDVINGLPHAGIRDDKFEVEDSLDLPEFMQDLSEEDIEVYERNAAQKREDEDYSI
jgi:hypothetical protein